MNSNEEARDWREDYFENPKLHKALGRLEKLGADIEYVSWLACLVRRADESHRPRPIKSVTVRVPPWQHYQGPPSLQGRKIDTN